MGKSVEFSVPIDQFAVANNLGFEVPNTPIKIRRDQEGIEYVCLESSIEYVEEMIERQKTLGYNNISIVFGQIIDGQMLVKKFVDTKRTTVLSSAPDIDDIVTPEKPKKGKKEKK